MKKIEENKVMGKDVCPSDRKISRKSALKMAGYLAVSAATTMILLSNPNKAMAGSPTPPP